MNKNFKNLTLILTISFLTISTKMFAPPSDFFDLYSGYESRGTSSQIKYLLTQQDTINASLLEFEAGLHTLEHPSDSDALVLDPNKDAKIASLKEKIKQKKTALRAIDNQLSKYEAPGFKDIIVRSALGEDAKTLARDFRSNDASFPIIALDILAGTGTRVISRRLESAVDKTIGSAFEKLLATGINWATIPFTWTYNKFTGREGEPLLYTEIEAWGVMLENTAKQLITISTKATTLGGREKMQRMSLDEESAPENVYDAQWEGIKKLYTTLFLNVADQLNEKLKYYSESSSSKDKQIVVYGTQARDWIKAFIEQCFSKTKTYKDLGSSNNVIFLNSLRSQLNICFGILLGYLADNENQKTKPQSNYNSPYSGGFAKPSRYPSSFNNPDYSMGIGGDSMMDASD
ncbi:TPA: hypothetical protein DEO28_04155 [Candidatus Dependentiae bacterium]|nr:MAG: hypothetical protein UR14_C0006G0068 [candidate division TM6 bacterium GW2011_GWE2_31_21]KKP53509.1 MAG: hypothetical protein UR43_C0004G0050 [candidate division TM6 bacterium GW2011_GWF2_33_332]HBS48250.1 hypothetical protein [Candidatus Dependentiae bacterium]HBZ73676.1 hypothetical protein [Candidatus Dependentiae bacterium]